jgi:hypothetical protein
MHICCFLVESHIWSGMDSIDLAQDMDQRNALGNMVNEPSGSIDC